MNDRTERLAATIRSKMYIRVETSWTLNDMDFDGLKLVGYHADTGQRLASCKTEAELNELTEAQIVKWARREVDDFLARQRGTRRAIRIEREMEAE